MFGIAKPIPFKFVTTYRAAADSFPPLFFFFFTRPIKLRACYKRQQAWSLSSLATLLSNNYMSTETLDIDAKMFKSS